MSVTDSPVARPAPTPAPAPDLYLPAPPDDTEKYGYFGRPRRLVFGWLLLASAGVLYGYVHVAARAWLVSPLMWLLLMGMVPPGVGNFLLRAGRAPRRVPAQRRGAAGPAGQHAAARQPAALGRPPDHLRARRLGPPRSPRPGRPLRAALCGAAGPGPDEEGRQPDPRPRHQRRGVHRGHRRRLRGPARVPVRDHALLRRG